MYIYTYIYICMMACQKEVSKLVDLRTEYGCRWHKGSSQTIVGTFRLPFWGNRSCLWTVAARPGQSEPRSHWARKYCPANLRNGQFASHKLAHITCITIKSKQHLGYWHVQYVFKTFQNQHHKILVSWYPNSRVSWPTTRALCLLKPKRQS